MMSNSIEALIFLTYLTNYNIGDIYKFCEYDDINLALVEYSAYMADKNVHVGSKEYDAALAKTKLALDKLLFYDIKAVPYNSPEYPGNLRQLSDKPPVLYIKGSLYPSPLVAVVGTRNPSPLAGDYLNPIVDLIGELGYGVISGLAHGIDSIAHNRALKKEIYTAAVLPNSLDQIYPSENYGMAAEILHSRGALISELIFGINRGKKSFVERNRLQSALSKYVLPIEMGINSGTMHTINFSIRQRKKLLLPVYESEKYRSYSESIEGINYLIRQLEGKVNSNIYLCKTLDEYRDVLSNKGKGVAPLTLF